MENMDVFVAKEQCENDRGQDEEEADTTGLLQSREEALQLGADEEAGRRHEKDSAAEALPPESSANHLLINPSQQEDESGEAEQRLSVDSKSSKRSQKSKKNREKLSENLRISQRTLNFNPKDRDE